MNKQLTKQDQTLIDEFMGLGKSKRDYRLCYQEYGAIMQVVEKIEKLYETPKTFGIWVDITTTHVNIRHYPLNVIAGTWLDSPEKVKFATKLEAIYYCVLELIKWHQKQEKNNSTTKV